MHIHSSSCLVISISDVWTFIFYSPEENSFQIRCGVWYAICLSYGLRSYMGYLSPPWARVWPFPRVHLTHHITECNENRDLVPKLSFFPQKLPMAILLKKNDNFCQFKKKVKFLAIFWHSNRNFPEGEVHTAGFSFTFFVTCHERTFTFSKNNLFKMWCASQ